MFSVLFFFYLEIRGPNMRNPLLFISDSISEIYSILSDFISCYSNIFESCQILRWYLKKKAYKSPLNLNE